MVNALSESCIGCAEGLLTHCEGSGVHECRHDQDALAGVQARSQAAGAGTVARGGRRRAHLRQSHRSRSQGCDGPEITIDSQMYFCEQHSVVWMRDMAN